MSCVHLFPEHHLSQQGELPKQLSASLCATHAAPDKELWMLCESIWKLNSPHTRLQPSRFTWKLLPAVSRTHLIIFFFQMRTWHLAPQDGSLDNVVAKVGPTINMLRLLATSFWTGQCGAEHLSYSISEDEVWAHHHKKQHLLSVLTTLTILQGKQHYFAGDLSHPLCGMLSRCTSAQEEVKSNSIHLTWVLPEQLKPSFPPTDHTCSELC